MAWYHPRDLAEYLRWILSLRVAALVLIGFCLLMSELRLDWAERFLGAYLATTNAERPESGLIWEVGQRTRSAHQTLERILADRISTQREAREASGFNELADRLQPGQGVMLSADHFRRLYLALAPAQAGEMVSPFRLLEIFNRYRCDRVYLKKTVPEGGLSLYLLNPDNRVLESFEIPARMLRLGLEIAGAPAAGRLEDEPGFGGRIYPAERFFAALAELPEDVRSAAVPNPQRLLEVRGAILRVGIGDEVAGGYIRLGFESLEGEGPQVLLMQGHEWAVWQLRSRIETDRRPAAGTWGGGSP